MRSIVYAQSAEGCTRLTGSGPVGDAFRAGHARAVGAAVEVTVCLDAMADHLDAAVLASGSQSVDCTLEAVEGAHLTPRHTYLEGLIVVVSTDFALCHMYVLLLGAQRFPDPRINTLAPAGTNARLEDPR